MTAPRSVLIVGESLAGTTAARHLRTLGHTGPLTIIGAEEHGAYSRPPLSKVVLKDPAADQTLGLALDGLDADVIRSPAVAADTRRRTVTTADGRQVGYDALIVATGADARRLAAPGQRGELVLRTLDDARLLRARLADAGSAIVVGAGFLGMEVASACAARGIPVTVVDADRPLERILGDHLSAEITARASAHGIRFIQATGFATLTGDPVSGVALPDGTELTADLVVTCAGEVPSTGWLAGTGLADRLGVGIDDACATTVPGVFAAGDVTYLRGDGTRPERRAPFWSNAVAQGRTAAASALGLPPPGPAQDDYFWTEVAGLTVKIVGRLPLLGEPTTVQGSVADGRALLTWSHADGTSTAVAYGMRKPVAALRALAATSSPPSR
ncbi:NAD(P)/FAD-dependent oxidoreductase [Streptomyces sp. S.PNR 29]|uniref:NAD(P)/FAD-dependent oxidoreductase n=1 Tax=Streptomyces sp. S.PNR 29 TaxID=2973805 RepID=UPI0025B22216|nr:NAD(P)/FAD-dependent oxidoreductase [Streptomyces sp. S.PNR 29]MDN0198967.1 NAD(P)/FAD-dependent oxidoreductase [Streptomyces sp. S.PNR 29]